MKTYSEKLKDPRWQKKRLQVLERDDWSCQWCHTKDETLHVHHLFYCDGKEPWEYDHEDLVTLCAECHEMETELINDSTRDAIQSLKKLGFMSGDFCWLENISDSLVEEFKETGQRRWEGKKILLKIFEELSRSLFEQRTKRLQGEKPLVIYADGACRNNGKGNARSSYAFYCPEPYYEEAGPARGENGKETNNVGELQAIFRALEYAKKKARNVIIYSDSQYAINSIIKWKLMPGKKNHDLILVCQDEMRCFENAELKWVKSHSGNPGNEKANELAELFLEDKLEIFGKEKGIEVYSQTMSPEARKKLRDFSFFND